MDYHRNFNSSKLSKYYLMPLILFDENTGTVPKSNVFSISAKFHVSIPFLASSFLSLSLASSSQRCFRPRSNHPTWSHIIKQLWGKLIPSESLVFHTFQFKAITHSGLLLQRGLCRAPHHRPSAPPPLIHPPPLAIPRVSSVTHHPSPSILLQRAFFNKYILCLVQARLSLQ